MRNKFIILYSIVCFVIILFLVHGVSFNHSFIIFGRLQRLCSLLLTAVAITYATLVFQSITTNKILTPSLMGYEHFYLLIQVVLLLLCGANSILIASKTFNFLLAAVLMILYSALLYRGFFKNRNKKLYFILLIGLVLSIFFHSTTQFLQMRIDPNEYAYVQQAMFSSLGRTSVATLLMAFALMLFTFIGLWRSFKYLDLINLGRNYARGLGVDYDRVVRWQLAGISILVSVSTALIGPITFVGIFVSGITYRLVTKASHRTTISFGFGVALILLISAQFLIERLFNYKQSLGVLVNLFGGVYFMFLLFKFLRK